MSSQPRKPRKTVGVDVGGTFTDLVWVEEAGEDVRVAKVPRPVPKLSPFEIGHKSAA